MLTVTSASYVSCTMASFSPVVQRRRRSRPDRTSILGIRLVKMGTLLLTLNKWEIVSGDLGGHYMLQDAVSTRSERHALVLFSSIGSPHASFSHWEFHS